MDNNYTDFESQVIALSAAAQAADLVDSIAQNGWCNNSRASVLLKSLFVFDPQDISDIYPGIDSLKPGLRNLRDILAEGAQPEHQGTVKYILGMIQLANLLKKQKDLGNVLQSRLKAIAPRVTDDWQLADDKALYHDIASAYLDTLATLKFRIQVTGNPIHLKNDEHTDRIRTFLMAGVRASMLWFQLGGNRFKLIFFRKKILRTLDRLLA